MTSSLEDAMYIRQVVKRVSRLMDRVWETEAQQSGLTRPQVDVLRELYHFGGVSLMDLSQKLDMAHSTVSGIIDRLEKKGLVVRRMDDKDKRRSRLYVTTMVDEYVEQVMPSAFNAPLVESLSKMTDVEREQIRIGLSVLERALAGNNFDKNT